ncbi:protein of unknown function [Amycolatopsis xylanica]|uniref:DUF4383 domain-containing protein n=1 Tax=Amycolatopsis xylanica TaxID=589385 RepID=A0A1H2VF35_9PSEU|nr:DUF4383 domain-containing protein [Amycolatopsis xylanica]SDW66965.1 protein of unknown function [Amycolatopsis xylanica]
MPLTRLLMLVIGVVYLAAGVLGFVLAPEPMSAVGHQPSNAVWIFTVSGTQNLLHTLLGALALLSSFKEIHARAFAWVGFCVLLGFTAYGVLAASTQREGDAALNINWPDNVLHLASALVCLAAATVASRQRADQT